jgi:hypothetical protein
MAYSAKEFNCPLCVEFPWPNTPCGYYTITGFSAQKFHVRPIDFIFSFPDLRTNSYYLHKQHKLHGFYNPTECVYCAVGW